MTDTANKQAGEIARRLSREFDIQFGIGNQHSFKSFLAIIEQALETESAALREEVERLRSLVTRALILAGGYSTEQRRFWNELIREAEAVIKKDG